MARINCALAPGLMAIAIACCASVAVADDRAVCTGTDAPNDVRIEVCTRLIGIGQLQGHELARTYNSRGIAYEGKGDHDHALADFNEATKTDPNFGAPYSNRGWTYNHKGEYDRAISELNEAIRLDPKFATAYANRGWSWHNKSKDDQALADLDQAIKLNPNVSKFYIDRGNIWRAKKDEDRAFADFDQAVRLDPKSARPLASRGWSFFLKKDYQHALADYTEAIKLDPKWADLYNGRGAIHRARNEPDKALTDLDVAIQLAPRWAIPHYNRGAAWQAKGQLDKAIADHDEAVKLDPTYLASFTRRGQAYEAKGDRTRAIADFKAALALPVKYDNGAWAHNTAEARLAVLTADQDGGKATSTTTSPTGTKGRLALVIGNGAYANANTLPNPANDARLVAKTLRDIGFEVLEGVDLDRTGMEQLVREFLRKAPLSKISLLFYAGHGLQANGKNYLVPIDAKLAAATDLPFETVDVDQVLAGLDDEARANVVILDACRDNPLARNLTAKSRSASASSGLAAVSTGTGTLIAYATAPGATALDGTGANSPFTTALVKHLHDPVEVNQLMTRVRSEVATGTKKQQIPWTNSSLLGEIYLAGGPKS